MHSDPRDWFMQETKGYVDGLESVRTNSGRCAEPRRRDVLAAGAFTHHLLVAL